MSARSRPEWVVALVDLIEMGLADSMIDEDGHVRYLLTREGRLALIQAQREVAQ
jgi:hypothetical protein